MLTESATVAVLKRDTLWVEARQKSQCSGCTARSSCGHHLLDKLHKQRAVPIPVSVPDARLLEDLQIGDAVTVGLPDSLVLNISFLLYLLPLTAMIAASVCASLWGATEVLIIIAGTAGLALGFAMVRRVSESRIAGLQVVLLEVANSGLVAPEAKQTINILSGERIYHDGQG